MQVDIKQITTAKKEISIIIDAETSKKAYNDYFAEASQNTIIPGFRKGKAPLNLIVRTYGDMIKDKFIKSYIDEVFKQVVVENQLNYLLYPIVKDVKWDIDQPFEFVIEIEHEPVIEFSQLEGLKVYYQPIELKTEVENYIKELQEENSILIDVDEPIRKNDKVEFEVVLTTSEQELKSIYSLIVSDLKNKELYEAALGKKIGDSFKCNISQTLLHAIFPKYHHDDHTQNVEVIMMVNAIQRKVLPTIDDEFAKDLEFNSLDDMYKKIESELSEKNKEKNINIMYNNLIIKLLEDNKFDLPENVLDYMVQNEMGKYQKYKNHDIYKYFEEQVKYKYIEDLITMYLFKALRKKIPIELTNEDYQEYYKHEAILSDQSVEEWLNAHAEEIKENSFINSVTNFTLLKKIAATCEFIPQLPEIPKDENKDSENLDKINDTSKYNTIFASTE